ncbi:hypothetical protein ACEPAG_2189 [Sanghuangporus baumii]
MLKIVDDAWKEAKGDLAKYVNELIGYDYAGDLWAPVTRYETSRNGQTGFNTHKRAYFAAQELENFSPSPYKACQLLEEEEYLWLLSLADVIMETHGHFCRSHNLERISSSDPIPDIIEEIAHFRLPEEHWSILSSTYSDANLSIDPALVFLNVGNETQTTSRSVATPEAETITNQPPLFLPDVSPFH